MSRDFFNFNGIAFLISKVFKRIVVANIFDNFFEIGEFGFGVFSVLDESAKIV